MSETPVGPAVRLQGRPGALEGLLEAPPELRKSVSVAQRGYEAPEAAPRVLTAPAGPSHTLVRLVMPPSTPPGTYEASIVVGDVEYPATIEVQAEPSLQVVPDGLVVNTTPGGDAEAVIHVLNTGNVALPIERAYAFGLFEDDGLEKAIGTALTSADEGGRRLDRLMDDLAARHGGLVRVAVREGAGDLAPGEARRVSAALRVSEHAEAGRTYTAVWPLGPANCRVEVVVAPRKRPSSRPRKERT